MTCRKSLALENAWFKAALRGGETSCLLLARPVSIIDFDDCTGNALGGGGNKEE
jgi:hypothetical protein